MQKMVNKVTFLLGSCLLTFMTLHSGAAMAAPLSAADNIPNRPLFLQTRVKPNILAVVDDSGSMDFETMIAGADNGAYRPIGSTAWWQDYFYPIPSGNQLFTDPTWYYPNAPSEQFFQVTVPAAQPGMVAQANTELNSIWRLWNSEYNKMYYNPKVNYTPWVGMPDADPATVATNTGPYVVRWNGQVWNGGQSSPGFWAARYYVWNDTNSDGQVNDPFASQTLVEICSPADQTAGNCTAPAGGYAGGPDRTDCAACVGDPPPASCTCTYAEEIQNFANWFRYYRKRDYVVKRALSDVFESSAERVGLATLHNNNNVATEISDVEIAANKANLLNELFNIAPGGGTPLRTALQGAGTYFENGGGVIPGEPSPILTQAEGGQCQQNFTLLMTDGYWNGPNPGVGNTDTDGPGGYDGGSYADNEPDTLADVAMHYYERDLSSLPDQVPLTTSLNDTNPGQHMVTYGVSFGLNGNLSSNPPDFTSPFAWPAPVANLPTTIDDLRHAAWNGRGEFLSAGDPSTLINSLNAVFGGIGNRVGSAANVTFDSPVLSAGSKIFISEFNSSVWKGDLTAFNIDSATGLLIQPPAWQASALLDADSSSAGSNARVMLTYKGNDGIRFRWNQLSSAQKNDFRTKPSGGLQSNAKGRQRFRYIRGDRNREQSQGGNFRNRSSRLGDIIHSGPAFVGDKPSTWRNDGTYAGYDSFVSSTLRTPVVYVGSNDGMLHGFRASDGKEVLAYIPGAVYSTDSGKGLHYLTDPKYTHQYYVDLTPVVADAKVGANWKTILVGGLRGGGRGYFALDVTDPANFSEANAASIVEWEFTNNDDPDLGFSYSEPSIVPLENDEWVAIFGNGYKDTGEGKAKLFIVKLNRGPGGWILNSNYFKISTGAGSTTNRNGLSTPRVVDVDGNGKADLVYAGDLQGNIWAFDISNAANLSTATARKLFQAPSGQAITSAPTVVRHSPADTTAPDLHVMFGTGQYLVNDDVTDITEQSFYGVWDNGSLATRADLVEQTFKSLTTGSGRVARVLTKNIVNYPAKRGWYIDLDDPAQKGERVNIHPIARGNNVWFLTSVPATKPCDNAGTGFLMVADIFSGGAPVRASFDVNQDGNVDAGDLFIDTDGDGEADLALDTLDTDGDGDIDNNIDLDGDGTVDTVSDLDGDGDIDFDDLGTLLDTLPAAVTYGAGGVETNVGLTGGLDILGEYAYPTGAQSNVSSPEKLEKIPDALLNRVSWEEL